MARNYVTLDNLANDFLLSVQEDDYTSSVSKPLILNYLKRAIREMEFDVHKRVKSMKIEVSSNNTVVLPSDYVDVVKIGVVGGDGMVYVFGENKNVNYSMNNSGTAGAPVQGTSDSKTATTGFSSTPTDELDLDHYVFNNYLLDGNYGQLYGIGGGQRYGDYRINLDQNRIELDTSSSYSEVVLEYICDPALEANPSVHVYAEEAVRSFAYYKLIERKSSVPAGEKARARKEAYNEMRKAKARLSNFTKEEALRIIRKNFKQSPKL
jgi:hypothetical protein